MSGHKQELIGGNEASDSNFCCTSSPRTEGPRRLLGAFSNFPGNSLVRSRTENPARAQQSNFFLGDSKSVDAKTLNPAIGTQNHQQPSSAGKPALGPARRISEVSYPNPSQGSATMFRCCCRLFFFFFKAEMCLRHYFRKTSSKTFQLKKKKRSGISAL